MWFVTFARLAYFVHAHHYAEHKLPHSIGGDNDVEKAIADAVAHLANPKVADVLLAANRERIALLLKGESWVFGHMRATVLQEYEFHDVRQMLRERELRSLLAHYGIIPIHATRLH